MAKTTKKLSSIEFSVMFQYELCAHVIVNKETKEIKVTHYTDINWKKGVYNKNATWKDIMEFFESRCFPRTRENCNELLNDMGLKTYCPLDIVKITHGVLWDDFTWIRFAGEDLTFDDIRIR